MSFHACPLSLEPCLCMYLCACILSKYQRFTRSRLFEIWGRFRPVQKHGVRVSAEIPALTYAETRATEKVVLVLELVFDLKLSILYLSPLCQTFSNAFSSSRKAATTCSHLLKLSMMDWDSLNRWPSVDLVLLKPD